MSTPKLFTMLPLRDINQSCLEIEILRGRADVHIYFLSVKLMENLRDIAAL